MSARRKAAAQFRGQAAFRFDDKRGLHKTFYRSGMRSESEKNLAACVYKLLEQEARGGDKTTVFDKDPYRKFGRYAATLCALTTLPADYGALDERRKIAVLTACAKETLQAVQSIVGQEDVKEVAGMQEMIVIFIEVV